MSKIKIAISHVLYQVLRLSGSAGNILAPANENSFLFQFSLQFNESDESLCFVACYTFATKTRSCKECGIAVFNPTSE